MTIPSDVIEALRRFRAEHGRRWKSKLVELWATGGDVSEPALRRARNVVGPSSLYRLDLDRCGR
jgi:hypothetical protein